MLKVFIQLISIYRAIAMLLFILFYNINTNIINSILLILAITSDLLDGYLAKKFCQESIGGQLLDLFSDKYLNCISVLFLSIHKYPLFPLMLILMKEIFVLSFRSMKIDEQFIIKTNRMIGGFLSGALWLAVFLQVNRLFSTIIKNMVYILGMLNLIYLLYKIASNFESLKKTFKE